MKIYLGCIACKENLYDSGKLTIGSWVRMAPYIKCRMIRLI